MHANLYLKLARQWSAKFITEQAPESLKNMDNRIGSIETALKRTAESEQLDQPELARDLAVIMSDYYDKRGRWEDWIKLGSLGLDACLRLGDAHSLGEAYPTICNGIGLMHRMLGSLDEAMSFYEQALERAKRDELKSDALTNMADIHRLNGDFQKALLRAELAVELGQKADDKNREAKGLEYMGLTHTALKDYNKAVCCHREALLLREKAGNLPRISLVLDFLSSALIQCGDDESLKQALEGYQRALKLEKQLNNTQRIAGCYGAIGTIHCKLGMFEDSIENLQIALSLLGDIGYLRAIMQMHLQLAYVYCESSNLDSALFHASEACKYRNHAFYSDRIQIASVLCQTLLNLTDHCKVQGRSEQVREFASVTIEFAEEAGESESLERARAVLTTI